MFELFHNRARRSGKLWFGVTYASFWLAQYRKEKIEFPLYFEPVIKQVAPHMLIKINGDSCSVTFPRCDK